MNLTRRKFIKRIASSAAVAAAFPTIIPSSALGKDGHVAPSNRIVMGAIGIGWQGGTNLNNFLGDERVQFVAMCDVDKKHLKGAVDKVNGRYRNKDCVGYNDYREMIAKHSLDAVSISLPDHWHAIPAIDCAKAGIDIFGEKPLSHNLRDGRAICDAIAKHGRIWQTGSWQRSTANFHHACELVINGRIGNIERVEVVINGSFADYCRNRHQNQPCNPPAELDYDRWLGPAPWAPYAPARVHKNWRWHMDYGGGKLMDWVGHHVDIAHWGMGYDRTGPVEIEGKGGWSENEVLWNAPTKYEITCKYAAGVELKILSGGARGGATWFGENGWINSDRRGNQASDPGILQDKIGASEKRLYKSTHHWRNFIDCVISRKETITPAEVAHRSASVGHLGHIAMKTGRKLKWNPDKEQIIDDPGASDLLSESHREPYVL